MSVHHTAIVSGEARIATTAEIGPYSVIAGNVEIGAGTVVESHVRIGHPAGQVVIGARNYIQSGAALGGPPQDLGYDGSPTQLVIGDDNRIGEYASINLGSVKGGGVTRVGSHCFIMAYAHVGHDCQLDDKVILTNCVQLAGHVIVEEQALLSGRAGVTQFVRVGALSFLAAGAIANKDIPPYTIAEGQWATVRAVNRVGLKRAGIEAADRRNIERALRLLLDTSSTVEQAVEAIRHGCAPGPRIAHLIEFATGSQKGLARA